VRKERTLKKYEQTNFDTDILEVRYPTRVYRRNYTRWCLCMSWR